MSEIVPSERSLLIQRLEADILRQRREFVRILNLAVNDSCTCGGRGPDDPDRCPACSVWHLVMASDG